MEIVLSNQNIIFNQNIVFNEFKNILFCHNTNDILKNPVLLNDGFIYEKSHLIKTKLKKSLYNNEKIIYSKKKKIKVLNNIIDDIIKHHDYSYYLYHINKKNIINIFIKQNYEKFFDYNYINIDIIYSKKYIINNIIDFFKSKNDLKIQKYFIDILHYNELDYWLIYILILSKNNDLIKHFIKSKNINYLDVRHFFNYYLIKLLFGNKIINPINQSFSIKKLCLLSDMEILNKIINNYTITMDSNNDNIYLIHYCFKYNKFETIKYLMSNNFNLDIKTCFGWKPFHYAAYFSNNEILEYVVKNDNFNKCGNIKKIKINGCIYYRNYNVKDLIEMNQNLNQYEKNKIL